MFQVLYCIVTASKVFRVDCNVPIPSKIILLTMTEKNRQKWSPYYVPWFHEGSKTKQEFKEKISYELAQKILAFQFLHIFILALKAIQPSSWLAIHARLCGDSVPENQMQSLPPILSLTVIIFSCHSKDHQLLMKDFFPFFISIPRLFCQWTDHPDMKYPEGI